ncbi:potassium channel subfamily K member 18-like [Daktulosphaira vitifoliae]|uniref:potassium channel subfamily K member 18-like n=1 Tax=Daktulosphaira vitifoliae TaxID=58002 RepID=UPI0021AA9E9E|nr:potassium channel subfamily K member 18-like [Daktulosphaira vitifoliae]XP_050548642.1 potassium channel subfamily K member 18-like [Daktulosphaira vitifoliae]XP_050548643.1 potassium channel subfamily K member 18-like [Daktulosphaira vitifoliae]XP_050548644.1 potassium channel subfamily K member 18-like [Daktulosphaira vitifoliae]
MDRTCCGQPAPYNYAVASGHTSVTGTCKGTAVSCYPVSYDGRPAAGISVEMDEPQGCFCCDSDDDSVERARLAHEKRKCYKSFAKNIFVCALLVSYTFAGALIFLSIEGDVGDEDGGPVRLAGLMPSSAQVNNLTAALLAAAGQESRARTVESIWEITVNLNILYRENWTRLAAQELNRFQEDLIRRLSQQMEIESAAVSYHTSSSGRDNGDLIDTGFEWNLATSFLYCLSILTTIGYGNITPKTALGKMATMVYALIGIPLMLVYLSSVGGLLAWCARGIFTRSLCCCLCSKCGYCCYDEKLMEEKERRMRLKRERREYDMQMKTLSGQALEPYYVRPGDSDSVFQRVTEKSTATPASSSSATADSASAGPENVSFVPLLLVGFAFMSAYIACGAAVLQKLDGGKSYLDCVFFCFMLLSTIGYGNSLPLEMTLTNTATVWFCSVYILSGMALTAMCFNIVHHGVSTKLKTLHDNPQPYNTEHRTSCGSISISDLTHGNSEHS